MLNLEILVARFLFLFILYIVIIKVTEARFIDDDDDDEDIDKSGRSKYAIVFFHGLGEDGICWQKSFYSMRLKYTDIVLPTAKKIPVTLANREYLPGWFDYQGSETIENDDEDGIKRSMQLGDTLIRKQLKKGIRSYNIIIGGFDQGGALALLLGMRFKKKLGGVIALSAWLPRIFDRYDGNSMTKNRDIPVLVCHGTKDPVIPVKYGKEISTRLKRITTNVTFKLYDNLTHKITPNEMKDVYDFLLTTLNITQT